MAWELTGVFRGRKEENGYAGNYGARISARGGKEPLSAKIAIRSESWEEIW